jgi:lipid II:glycine glycyltransferase (peptidoglycan interpeptide bridge formation enzyme)
MDAPSGWDDAAARSPWGHVMQSSIWAAVRERQGWHAEYVSVGDPLPLALVLWKDLVAGQRIAYVPRGPVVAPSDSAALRRVLGRLADLAREHGAIFLKVDPELDAEFAAEPLRAAGFFRSSQDIQPVLATLELDLGPDEDALLAAMDKDTRWSVRQGPKKGVSVTEVTGDDGLRAFYDLYALTGRRADFITRTWEYYRSLWRALIDARLATLRLAHVDRGAVAGAMTWRCGERVVYQTGATNDAARKSHAAYALLWECIIGAKREGARRFNFGGIPTDVERKDDPMYGPYLFKRGFGGVARRWVGAHDVAPRTLAYRAYLLAEPAYTSALRFAGRLRR